MLVSAQPAGSAKKREIKDLEAKGSRGVVTKVGRQAVCVALDRDDDDNVAMMKRVWLVKVIPPRSLSVDRQAPRRMDGTKSSSRTMSRIGGNVIS